MEPFSGYAPVIQFAHPIFREGQPMSSKERDMLCVFHTYLVRLEIKQTRRKAAV